METQMSDEEQVKDKKSDSSKPITVDIEELRRIVSQISSVANISSLVFYRRWFPRLLLSVVASCATSVVLIVILCVLHVQKVDRQYFGLDFKTGRMIPIVPLDTPYVSDSALLGIVKKCAEDASTYDFVNYKKQLQAVSDTCFTDEGWNQFAAALMASGNIDRVAKQRLVSVASVNGPAVITKKGEVSGTYSWEMQMPLFVTYQGEKNSYSQRLKLTLRIERRSTEKSETGVGIAQWIAEESSQ